MTAFELRVLITTTDKRLDAGEKIEAEVARALGHLYGAQVYVERVTTQGVRR